MKPINNESLIFEAVKAGLLQIKPDGTIWKVAELRGNRWNSRVNLRKITPRRAENDQGGYFQVRWMQRGKRIHCMAHRLVWMNRHGSVPIDKQINHKNGDKKDNRPENLEVVSASENLRHAYKMGMKDEHGQNNPSAKLSDSQVAAIRMMYKDGFKTQAQIANQFMVSHQAISKIVRGDRRKKQNGHTEDYTTRRGRGIRTRNSRGSFTSA